MPKLAEQDYKTKSQMLQQQQNGNNTSNEHNYNAFPDNNNDCFALWNKICHILISKIGEATFRSWISPLQMIGIEDGMVMLAAPSRFIKDWIASHYQSQILQLMRMENPEIHALEITIGGTVSNNTPYQNNNYHNNQHYPAPHNHAPNLNYPGNPHQSIPPQTQQGRNPYQSHAHNAAIANHGNGHHYPPSHHYPPNGYNAHHNAAHHPNHYHPSGLPTNISPMMHNQQHHGNGYYPAAHHHPQQNHNGYHGSRSANPGSAHHSHHYPPHHNHQNSGNWQQQNQFMNANQELNPQAHHNPNIYNPQINGQPNRQPSGQAPSNISNHSHLYDSIYQTEKSLHDEHKQFAEEQSEESPYENTNNEQQQSHAHFPENDSNTDSQQLELNIDRLDPEEEQTQNNEAILQEPSEQYDADIINKNSIGKEDLTENIENSNNYENQQNDYNNTESDHDEIIPHSNQQIDDDSPIANNLNQQENIDINSSFPNNIATAPEHYPTYHNNGYPPPPSHDYGYNHMANNGMAGYLPNHIDAMPSPQQQPSPNNNTAYPYHHPLNRYDEYMNNMGNHNNYYGKNENEEHNKKLREFEEKFDAEIRTPLNSRYSFDSFVVGKPNAFAHAAALRLADEIIASSPQMPVSRDCNPLFLYGGVGLGKTHLMHAIAWRVVQHNPSKKVLYLSAEKFMNQFVQSLRHKETFGFKEYLRNVDVLMVDDIQFFSGKDYTQEEFFHTFNALIDHNKAIIISGDCSPSSMTGIEERIKSRLSQGLVADIHATSYELRLGILQTKAEQSGHQFSDDVLELLANRVTSNVRELEGAFKKIIQYAMVSGGNITVDTVHFILQDVLKSSGQKASIESIQRYIADSYGLQLSDLQSTRRSRNIARPRQIAMYLAKKITGKSLPELGRKFMKDHTTVMHAIRKVDELISSDPKFKEEVEKHKNTLSGNA